MDTQEARIYIAIIITVVLLGVIIGFFAVSIIKQQKRNLELQKANALAEITAMEKERARIAADLHDDLGPVMSVIKFRVDHVELVDKSEKEELIKASEQLDELIGRMREVANNLMPSALSRKGFVSAVREFISNVMSSGELVVDFRCDEALQVGEEKSIHLYRVIQEAVHNCIKHARASQMEIVIEQKGNMLQILCRDNGKGFNYEQMTKEATGIGLRSLKNRTEMMGGRLHAESKPGKGTVFLFEIPIK